MVITQKFELGIGSNFLHNIRTSICIWKCNKNFWWFRSHFLEKTMGYSTGKFSENGPFLKMVITRKFELGISSNFLHNIRTSICIWKCNKNFWWFLSHFLEKTMGYSTGKFSENGWFLKMIITRKFELEIGSNFLHNIKTSICIWKCNKKFLVISEPFFGKTMGYSTGKFSENGSFLKMVITWKFELGISSNTLHNIRTSICIWKCNKIGGDFGAIFWKKPWAIVQGNFQKMAHFLKWS